MEIDSDWRSVLSLEHMKVPKCCLPPKTWEFIPSESGAARAVPAPGVPSFAANPIYEPSVASEAALVRMVINALQGNKAALDDIETLSACFCSTPADRTVHRVPSLWERSSSTNALGKILKSFSQSGYLFLFLSEFVDHFCVTSASGRNSCGFTANRTVTVRESLESKSGQGVGEIPYKVEANPPYTLVNQAFAVAVRTVLEGYICAINTLLVSVRLRRSTNTNNKASLNSWDQGSLTSIIGSDVTLLEVYLHTKELRTHIEALGNICLIGCDKDLFTYLHGKKESLGDHLLFDCFPRGADLLTYLYIQLRDSDPVHHALLRFLFTRSCEPYCSFINSWIYKAKIDDPFKEFIIEATDSFPSSDGSIGYTSDIGLAFVKERNGISLPFFLEDVHLPLFRAGQQLQVLLKLLDFCNCFIAGNQNKGGASMTCNLASFDSVLPFWNDCPNYSYNCLTFSGEEIRKMTIERHNMYSVFLDTLNNFFADLHTRSQQIKSLVNSSDLLMSLGNRSYGDSCARFMLIEGLDFSGYIFDNESVSMVAGYKTTDISSTSDDSLNGIDDTQFSESSSLNTTEEESEHMETIWFPDVGISDSYFKRGGYQRMHQIEKSLLVQETHVEVDQMNSRDQIKEVNLDLVPHSPQCDEKENSTITEILGGECHTLSCWPLGGLLKNPFHPEASYIDQKQQNLIALDPRYPEGVGEFLEKDNFYPNETFLIHKAKLESSRGQVSHDSEYLGSLSTAEVCQSWVRKNHYILNRNPMLNKATWIGAICSTMHENLMHNGRSVSYFDFSWVLDPQKIFLERSTTFKNYGSDYLSTITEDYGVCDSCMDEHICDSERVDESDFCSTAFSSNNLHDDIQERELSGSQSDGAKWEVSSNYCGNTTSRSTRSLTCSSEFTDMPLDFIIDKCIIQEVILQYKYVSKFTVKLLDEGFALREHLMALRRYYFMELADWADSFIMSLWNHKWFVTEPNCRVAEMQSLLDMALQRSSCESDPYRERLFIYTKGESVVPLSAKSIGIFDLVLLGYRVDWPICIVVSPKALTIYADIFSFLMQVRLAIFSLSDLWLPIKVLLHSKGGGQSFDTTSLKKYNTLLKVRLQVNHFVSTLQQYVQSQLSDVSWNKFLYYLKHQVKDMLDLEATHMSYLGYALHICFLSSEMQSISSIIKRILQCALDFQLCSNRNSWDVVSDGELDPTSLLAGINFSQVLAVKAAFEQSMKDLYMFYLKSPKHCESGICRLWEHLNINDYYSNIAQCAADL